MFIYNYSADFVDLHRSQVLNHVLHNNFSGWQNYFDGLVYERAPIDKCYRSGYGNKLELKYADETNALKPPVDIVPWVVVDGQPLSENYENVLLSHICKAYKSKGFSSLRSDCDDLTISKIPKEKARHVHELSYKGSFKRKGLRI